jgi:hypothetical protein
MEVWHSRWNSPSARVRLKKRVALTMELDLNVEMPTVTAVSPPPPPPLHQQAPAVKMKPMVPSVGRLDLLEKKRRLDQNLGASQADYWAAVEQYLTARISRTELYDAVLATLGVENMALHNDFFLAILYNAQSTELPPSRRQTAGKFLNYFPNSFAIFSLYDVSVFLFFFCVCFFAFVQVRSYFVVK